MKMPVLTCNLGENMYKEILTEGFVEQYKSYHMVLFRELNIMLFDVAFLKECILHNNIMLDTDIAISYLFKNNFEHLILKTYRIMFDNGADVLTMDSFIGYIIKNLKDEGLKQDLRRKISESYWKSDNIRVIKNRLQVSLGEFRNKAIAHKLTQEMKDLSVDLNDISEMLDAAIDIFEILSFYPLDFYRHKVTKFSFVAEKLTVQEKSKQLLDLLFIASSEIRHVDVQYRKEFDTLDLKPIENMVNQYNAIRREEDICTELLLESRIGAFTKIRLLQIDEFKKELLKYKTISDAEILNVVYEVRRKFLDDTSKDKIVDYKLSIIDSCIESIDKIIHESVD